MSGPAIGPGPLPVKVDPDKLVLRGRPRPVVRFRRGLIVGAAGAVVTAFVTLSWLALQSPTGGKPMPVTSDALPGAAPPDALAGAPKSYSDVPRLGPPLPGDLGRPILERERSLGPSGAETFARVGSDPQASRAQSAREERATALAAARTSPILVPLAVSRETRDLPPAAAQAISSSAAADASAQALPTRAGPEQKLAFARSSPGDLDPGRLHPAGTSSMLVAGTVIPASLITGINSDLPGIVLAQVTQDVCDSATGTRVLIPQGSRLIGRYDSLIAFGQRRALVVWNRILFPNGASIDVDNLPATDAAGYAGLSDGVDSRTWQLLKGIGLSTLLGVGSELGLGSHESDLARAIRESAQQGTANAGAQITSRELDIQPTITIRPGWPVRAILDKDLLVDVAPG